MPSLQSILTKSKNFEDLKIKLNDLKEDLVEKEYYEYNEWIPSLIAFLRRHKINLNSEECESLNFTHIKFSPSFGGCNWSSSVLRDLRIAVIPNPVMFKHLTSCFKSVSQFCQLLAEIGARGCDPFEYFGMNDSRRLDLFDMHKDETNEELMKSVEIILPVLYTTFKENLAYVDEVELPNLFYDVEEILSYNQVEEYEIDSFQVKFIHSLLELQSK